MRGLPLLSLLFVALPASADNSAQSSNPPVAPVRTSAAVFVVPRDPSVKERAGRLDTQLSRALLGQGVELVDLNAAFPPPAPESLEPAKAAYAEGRTAYDNLDPDTAVTKFNDAISAYLKHPVEVEPAALADAYVWLGASLQLRGDVAGAKSAFTTALLTDASATADPQFFGTDLLTLFGEARTELSKHPRGKLLVDSIPSGARVFLRGEDVGTTPIDEQETPSGRVRVVITRPGYVPFGAFPEVSSDKPLQLKPELEPTPGLSAMQAEVMKLTTPTAWAEAQVPVAAKAIGERLSARYLVIAAVGGDKHGEVQAWDLQTGNKLKGLPVDVSSGDWASTYTAAEKVKQWIANPPSTEPSKLAQVAKKWWFWAAVGGAAAVLATGVALAQPHHRPDLVLGTP